MNCCNDFGQCKQGFNCPARETRQSKGRAIESQSWSFPTEEEINDTNPFIEMVCQLWWGIKFMGYSALLFFCAFVAWEVFEYFKPSTACLLQQLFSINCK